MSDKNYIPYQKIVQHLNVQKGDVLVLASDITRMAIKASRQEGSFDPNLLIDSILQKIGTEGTLLIQAFNHDLKNGQKFNLKETWPQTGALAISAFFRPDFKRSFNPLHSFLVWGKEGPFFLKLQNIDSFGPDSPFAFFQKKKAKMLFLSSSISRALTYTHFVEQKLAVKYRHQRKLKIEYSSFEGKTQIRDFSIYAKKRGWDLNFQPLEKKMKNKGIVEEEMINGLRFQILPLNKAYDLIADDIQNNQARSIAFFSWPLFFKSLLKDYLYKIKLIKTTTDKIKNAGNLH
jgi:aminoglycoside 3-N-acetyltransferase